MKRLTDIIRNPSGFDSLANYLGDIPEPHWLVVLTRSRDSNTLGNCNWECAVRDIERECEPEDYEVFRFGHWGCGWWEALCVREGSDAEQVGFEIECALSDYPVLDDEAYCQAQYEEAQRVWATCYRDRDRLEYIRENRSQFEFASFGDLLACVRGKFFCGYASELLH
jgi:hypothetical protein